MIKVERSLEGWIVKLNGQVIGKASFDWKTFILFRELSDLSIRKYPGTVGMSMEVLQALISKGCHLVIVRVGQIHSLKVDPRLWIARSIKDRLTPEQDLHAFLPLKNFQTIGAPAWMSNRAKRLSFEDAELTKFLEKRQTM